MPVIAMQAVAAGPHPNADSLRLYRFEAPGREPVPVTQLEA